jgi:hypothetical protein
MIRFFQTKISLVLFVTAISVVVCYIRIPYCEIRRYCYWEQRMLQFNFASVLSEKRFSGIAPSLIPR